MTAHDIIAEPLVIHRDSAAASTPPRTDRVVELLHSSASAPSISDRYPHEFSGGQRQRIGIARALARPSS